MKVYGSAYFVENPRVIGDCMTPHPLERETLFEVVGIVKLAKIDYENFITDMVADRQFIEEYAALCGKGKIWRCIFIQQRGQKDGILVLPRDYCHVGWAAYYAG